jgi:hypothetical protein
MNILRILFLLCIYNSFVESFNIKGHCWHKNKKIMMGCDYYIEHNLWIHYKNKCISYVNLYRERGYYYDYFDDDGLLIDCDNESDSLREKLKRYHLRPRTEPITIYANNTFINAEYSQKYNAILEFEIINHDYKTWDDINEIILCEERTERD